MRVDLYKRISNFQSWSGSDSQYLDIPKYLSRSIHQASSDAHRDVTPFHRIVVIDGKLSCYTIELPILTGHIIYEFRG